MDYLKKSRIEEVLITILGKGAVTSQLISRIEKILDAIRVKGSYDDIAMSEVEEILVCILLGKRFEKPTHSRIAAMLKVKANGGEYTELRKSRVEDLIFEWINAVESATYTGTLPATLQTVAGYLESYKIYGNTVQNGTPTPDSPITPQGTGERTGNLFDVDARDTNNGYVNNMQLNQDGTMTSWTTSEITEYIELTPNATYTLTNIGSYNSLAYCIYDNDRQYITGVMYRGQSTKVINMPPNGKYLRFTHIKMKPNTMLNTGSTPLHYEPYGYKLSLSSAGQDVDIYLGESQTTRRIKKLVLTGGEVSTVDSSSKQAIIPLPNRCFEVSPLCTHYIGKITRAWSTVVNGEIAVLQQGSATARICDTTYATTATNYNNYLAQQYANGTPVTIWYVLATEETGIVNEPLRKIGDYADTIDSTQTTVQIPTAAGTTTISWAGEGLAPSEVELTYLKPK